MVKCPRCGHENLPSFPTCSRCGTPLAGGVGPGTQLPHASMGAPPPDEYANLMATRAASKRRNRSLGGAVFLVALVAGGYVWYQDWKHKAGSQQKLDYFERWADLDKRETGAFFGCVMASEVDMSNFSTADQVQQRVESAYFTQQKTFSEHLTVDCIPKLERARQALGSIKDAPEEYAAGLQKYQAVLPKLQGGIEEYAQKIQGRQGVKDVDTLIQEMGSAWQSGGVSPEGIAYEKFLHCAIPGLAKMKDTQQMLQFMADACFKKDPVAFMDRVRKDCGPILSSPPPKATPSKTWKLSQQRFLESDDRQLRAWEDCGRRSRKGKKKEDLADFLSAVGDYMEARTEVVKAAREIRASAGVK